MGRGKYLVRQHCSARKVEAIPVNADLHACAMDMNTVLA